MSGFAFACAANSGSAGYRRSSSRSVSIAWSLIRPFLPRSRRVERGREVGDRLAAVFGDEDQVLDAHAAEAVPVEARLERDHVARRRARARSSRGSAPRGPRARRRARGRGRSRRGAPRPPGLRSACVGMTALLEEVADASVDVAAVDARADHPPRASSSASRQSAVPRRDLGVGRRRPRTSSSCPRSSRSRRRAGRGRRRARRRSRGGPSPCRGRRPSAARARR